MAKKKIVESPKPDKLPVVKLTIPHELLDAIKAVKDESDTVQTWILQRLAEHLGIEPQFKRQGQRGKGKKRAGE